MTEKLRKRLGTICFMIAIFLNPFGYDILVYELTQLTKSYWITMLLLYVFAALFFIFAFIFLRINPFRHLHNNAKKITGRLKLIKNGKNI